MERSKPFVILVCDDDEDDRFLIKEAVQEVQFHSDLRFAVDGLELLDYLKRSEDKENSDAPPRPDLILLDLNMPRMDGREALKAIKSNVNYRSIPVIILTTSREEEDIAKTYKTGANSFISKPVSFGGLLEVIECFARYWTRVASLPLHCNRYISNQ